MSLLRQPNSGSSGLLNGLRMFEPHDDLDRLRDAEQLHESVVT
jgi:hypothetical protein